VSDLIQWDAARPDVYDTKHPWCRQPCDDEPSWHAWRAYLSMALPRTIKKLARSTGLPVGTLRRWYDTRGWRLRALAFDNYVHTLWQNKVEVEIVDAADDYVQRHARILAMGTELLERELTKYLDVSKSQNTTGLLRPEHLSQLANVFVKLERLHHDQSTDNVQVAATVDLSRLSLDELKELKRLNAKTEVK